jgi:hypothetical protein
VRLGGLGVLAALEAGAQAAESALEEVGIQLHAIVVRKLSQPGTGAFYRSRRGGGEHQASAPGEPPAVDLGVYRGSWKWAMASSTEVDIGTEDPRGPWLEFGTRTIEPRPHIRPSIEEFRPKITAMIAARIIAAERAAGGKVKVTSHPIDLAI